MSEKKITRREAREELFKLIFQTEIQGNSLQEAYEKSEEQIDFFIKRYPHLKTLVDNGTKDKSVFKKLNKQLDKLQAQREQLATEHKELDKTFKQLKQIEKNFDDYMNQGKSEPTSILKEIQKHKEADREQKKSRTNKLAQEER